VQVLDLKGVPRVMEQDLEDTFLMITSTKTDLDSTSFLSSLDMDPPLTGHATGGAGGGLLSPAASRVSLPLGQASATEGLFQSLSTSTQGSSTPATGSSTPDGTGKASISGFSEFRRFVSFGLRKDTAGPS
jgi:hypothetical protein